jgi:hypothetical protein
MCFSIRLVVCSCALGAFVFSGIAFAAERTAVVKEAAEQCSKGGKTLSTVKTKDECVKQGGAWEKMGIPTLPADSLDKKRQTKLPDDPLTKKNNTLRPPDPLEKNKAMPPAGHIAPSGGK